MTLTRAYEPPHNKLAVTVVAGKYAKGGVGMGACGRGTFSARFQDNIVQRYKTLEYVPGKQKMNVGQHRANGEQICRSKLSKPAQLLSLLI